MNTPELTRIRTKDQDTWSVLNKLVDAITSLSHRAGINPTGSVPSPAQPSSLTVTQANGIFTAVIEDRSPVNAGAVAINYFLEWSTDAAFPPGSVYGAFLGPNRNWTGYLGAQTLYFRCYSSYLNSAPSGYTRANASIAGGGSAPPTPPISTGSGASYHPGAGFGGSGRIKPSLE